MKRLLISLLLLIGASLPAYSQGAPLCYTTNGTNCVKVGTSGASAWGPLPVIISQGGNSVGISIDGNLLVATPPASQFFDAFSSTLDTTTNWTTNNSTGTAVTSGGNLVVSSSTTASAWGGLGSKQAWAPQGASLQVYGEFWSFANKTIANTARVWGMFTVPGTPTTAVPATDGYVWRLDGTGSLFAEVWASGVAVSSTNATTLCPITNSIPNTYAVYYRTGVTQFYCGATLAAQILGFMPTNQTLPTQAFAIAGSTPPLSNATMTGSGVVVATYSPAMGSKGAGQAPTINDPYGVVGFSPNANSVAVAQGANVSNVSPFGEFAIQATPQNVFQDTFDVSFDTTNNWNAATAAGGGVTVAQSPGQITLGTGTTANGYAYTTSKPTFRLVEPGFVVTGIAIKLPALASNPTNAYAAWGPLTPAAVPTAAIPITEGCAFEMQPGGATAKMYVACYAGSTRTVIQDLSAATGSAKQPTDGLTHTYYTFLAGDRMYWSIDGTATSNIVASQNSGVNGPNVNTQPVGLLAVAATSNPSLSLTLTVAATWVANTNTNGWIADGVYPYRKATVKAASTAPATTDLPIVVAVIPVAPVSTAALAANQVVKASNGNLYSLQVGADSTLSAAAWWLMLYDATVAPADGAVTPLKCYPFPSGTTSASMAFPTPVVFVNGIVAGVSTTGCFTKTASTHAFISGDAK